jgi:hypothetical protein
VPRCRGLDRRMAVALLATLAHGAKEIYFQTCSSPQEVMIIEESWMGITHSQ